MTKVFRCAVGLRDVARPLEEQRRDALSRLLQLDPQAALAQLARGEVDFEDPEAD